MTLYAENVHVSSKQTIRTNIQVGQGCRIQDKITKKQLCFSAQARNDPKKEKKKLRRKLDLYAIQKENKNKLRDAFNNRSIRLAK